MTASDRIEQARGRDFAPLAPPVVSRQRVVERAGQLDRATQVVGLAVAAILLVTAIVFVAVSLADHGPGGRDRVDTSSSAVL